MNTAEIALPPKLIALFDGDADARVAKGGRGSGKTRSFAKMTAVRAYMWAAAGENGQILCGRRIMKTLADSSMEEVKLAILEEPWLAEWFDIGETYIRTKGLPGAIYYTFLGLDRNIDSVKSQARIRLAWVDEAEGITDEAWTKLIPTLREEDSELWVTYNPERKNSATNKRFGESKDPRYRVVEINWRDNPRFPAKLERDRQRDKEERPDQYDHIWEGDYVSAVTGAYYASHLTEARAQNRISVVGRDPMLPVKAFFDIGGTGRSADATAIVIAQFIGLQVRVLDYYEARHQPLATHVNWLRERGYAKCHCILPHDGIQGDKVFDAAYEPALISAGFDAETIKNQGKGAAKLRIEAARRLFPNIWFNKDTTEGLVDALAWYHEKIDQERNIGLGPDHDFSSHAADAFGLMAIAYEQPSDKLTLPDISYDWAS